MLKLIMLLSFFFSEIPDGAITWKREQTRERHGKKFLSLLTLKKSFDRSPLTLQRGFDLRFSFDVGGVSLSRPLLFDGGGSRSEGAKPPVV